MNGKTTWFVAVVGLMLATNSFTRGQPTAGAAKKAQTPQALKAEIELLRGSE